MWAASPRRCLGNWMQARGNRAQIIVATKLGSAMGSGPNERGISRGHIMDAVEASLRRLHTDYIDLYQAHIDDRDTPLEETLRAFDDLIRQGKVRYIGASNYTAWRLATALWTSDTHGYARYETLQPRYNLAARAEYERELEPLCQEQGIGVITYSSLASGFFSGKYRAGRDLPTTPRAQGVQRGYMNAQGFAILDAVEGVAREAARRPARSPSPGFWRGPPSPRQSPAPPRWSKPANCSAPPICTWARMPSRPSMPRAPGVHSRAW